MTFQSTVNWDQAAGIEGEFVATGPRRVEPGILRSASAANNVFGRVFSETAAAPGIWRAGNPDDAGVRFAILVSPKEHASYGTAAGGPLAPTMTLPNETIASFMSMGEVWARSVTAADPGDVAIFAKATGIITMQPAGDAVPGTSQALPTGVTGRVNGVAGGLFALRMTA